MAGQSDPDISLFSAEEVEFMDEDELIEIVPNMRMDPLNFNCGDFGPFLPQIATQVPLWLAVALKKRGKCTIRPPQWMSLENLTRVLEGERDSQGALQMLPFRYVEISRLLFDHAPDDIPDMYMVRSLIEEIRDVRIHKVETSLACLVEQPQSYCKGAEVLLNLQPNSSVSIQYHPLFGPHDDLILLELDEKLLSDVLYHRVTLRGQPDEDAVLCTTSKTYSVKFAGTSNSVFLVPPADYSTLHEIRQDCEGENHKQLVAASVIKVAPGNMELVEVAPRLDKLKSILSENFYSSDESLAMEDLEFTERSMRRLYTWDDLTNKVQASDDELRTGLQALSAVEIDGYWRIVDEKYMDMILRMLLHNSVLNDWSLDALIEDKVVSVLESDGFPCKLAYHCLNAYGSRLEEAMDGGVWRMDARRVCVHFARGILREGKRKMESFMEEWLRMIPEEMQPSFDMLEGEVLTEKVGVETWVYAFSVSSLPSTPAERFSILFKERPKWEWKDLEPYIRDLNVPGLSSEALLLKYTRRTQTNTDAAPVFSAR